MSNLAILERLEAELDRRKRENRLRDYRPYAPVAKWHGMPHQERALIAANQVGKTFGAGCEVAMHLTGIYPEWWQGRRFTKAPVGWVAGVTGEATRDNPQRILLGRPGEWGTGTIPKARLSHVQKAPHRVADAVDYILVNHASGGLSRVYFKAYDQGREKFQGETLDFGWCDEEPPEDVYIEFLTRLNVTQGPMMLTFTPLLGMSSVVKRFIQEKRNGTAYVSMTIEDAEHYTPKQRAAIVDRYPAHEREARTKGVPSLGSGRIFPVTEEMLAYDTFTFPAHWPRVAGMDFGGVDHPAAAAFMAIDPDADCVYVYDAWRAKALFLEQAGAIRARCQDYIPIAWPHDGLQQDRHSGVQLAEQFRDQGLPMMPGRATFEDGTNGVEAGISLMLTMMQTGRFRVARHLRDVFEEISLYHRRDGKVVKEGDDVISAIRYGVMMRRYADTPPRYRASQGEAISTWMA